MWLQTTLIKGNATNRRCKSKENYNLLPVKVSCQYRRLVNEGRRYEYAESRHYENVLESEFSHHRFCRSKLRTRHR